ncbi:PaaI family thioesterase [Martelella sp. AMO21009]
MSDTATIEKLTPFLARSPFVAFMGIELAMIGADGLTLTARYRPEFARSPGDEPQWHGGVVAALIDTAGDVALIANLDFAPPTINMRVDYLRPAKGEMLRAVASIRKTGRSIGFVDIDVFDPQDRLVAIGRANYATTAG